VLMHVGFDRYRLNGPHMPPQKSVTASLARLKIRAALFIQSGTAAFARLKRRAAL